MSIFEVKVPSAGESITEVTISKLLKPSGSIVKLDEPICEVESEKATLEFPAEKSGKIEWLIKEGADVSIGQIIAHIDTSVSISSTEESPKKEELKEEKKETPISGHPSPSAQKILSENKLKTEEVLGTGKDGRITKEDALKAIQTKTTEAPVKETKTIVETKQLAVTSTTPASFSRNETRKKMSRMRRTIASRLVSAKNQTAMLTTFNEVDMSAINELRAKYQDRFVAKYGIKLGYMSLFAKACAKALMEMPDVNAYIEGDEVVHHQFADISVAVSTPNGLVVPPVHNVESLSLAEIEYKIKDLAEKARNGKLTIEEMTGGTFTITNGGIFGSMMSTPILNEPQSAILGMHAIIERPVAIAGKVEIRPMMYLALSYDHRIIDGSTSVTFLVRVKKFLEDPISLLLEV